jgi:hypothetical protein
MLAKNLEKNVLESQAKATEENKKNNAFSTNISFNTLYRI